MKTQKNETTALSIRLDKDVLNKLDDISTALETTRNMLINDILRKNMKSRIKTSLKDQEIALIKKYIHIAMVEEMEEWDALAKNIYVQINMILGYLEENKLSKEQRDKIYKDAEKNYIEHVVKGELRKPKWQEK